MNAKTAVGLLKDHNYRTGWQNAKEIADFIEQQARQIKAMRSCINCINHHKCKEKCKECFCYVDFGNWELAGGSNGN